MISDSYSSPLLTICYIVARLIPCPDELLSTFGSGSELRVVLSYGAKIVINYRELNSIHAISKVAIAATLVCLNYVTICVFNFSWPREIAISASLVNERHHPKKIT